MFARAATGYTCCTALQKPGYPWTIDVTVCCASLLIVALEQPTDQSCYIYADVFTVLQLELQLVLPADIDLTVVSF